MKIVRNRKLIDLIKENQRLNKHIAFEGSLELFNYLINNGMLAHQKYDRNPAICIKPNSKYINLTYFLGVDNNIFNKYIRIKKSDYINLL